MATNESQILDLSGANAKAKALLARRALSLTRRRSERRCNSAVVIYDAPLLRMKKIGLVILTGFSLLVAPVQLRAQTAQTDDPSEAFLKAYMTSQQGEKLEHDNQFKAALAKFRAAGSLLDEVRKAHAEWQPAIVEYRSRKIGESILRVQSKVGTQTDLAATAEPAASSSPYLPKNAGPA